MRQTLINAIALVIAIIAVHSLYIAVIWPGAETALEAAKAAGQSAPRNLFVILKDYEQEICLILMLWGSFLILSKIVVIMRGKYLFQVDLLDEKAHKSADLNVALASLEDLPRDIQDTPLVRTLVASIRRFLITENVQNTSDAIESGIDAMATKHETENSMIKYLIWAIPSIGFIGTVRGIGEALAQADQALAGDIAGMTNSLGVAFNSTFVALLISILLMFLLHQLQRLQDGLLVETQDYCEAFLLKRLSAKA